MGSTRRFLIGQRVRYCGHSIRMSTMMSKALEGHIGTIIHSSALETAWDYTVDFPTVRTQHFAMWDDELEAVEDSEVKDDFASILEGVEEVATSLKKTELAEQGDVLFGLIADLKKWRWAQ